LEKIMASPGEIRDLVCRAKAKPRELPALCLRLIQMKIGMDLLEQALGTLPSEYAGLRAAILGAVHCYGMPYASEQDLHAAAQQFSNASASPAGLVPMDRNTVGWMARMIDSAPRAAAARKDIIFGRRLERYPEKGIQFLFLCAGDPNYFFVFSEFYLHSVMEFAGTHSGVHFVLLDFSAAQLDRARALFRKYAGHVSISFSTMQPRPGISKSFYTVARFYELVELWPLLCRSEVRNLAITDIDHVFVRPVSILPIDDQSLAVGYVTANYLFPWLRFRANLLLVNLTCGPRGIVDTAISAMTENLTLLAASKMFWDVDQGALASMLQKVVLRSGHPSAVREITGQYLAISFQPTGDRSNAEAKFERMIALHNP
jgi:hypothetical protein